MSFVLGVHVLMKLQKEAHLGKADVCPLSSLVGPTLSKPSSVYLLASLERSLERMLVTSLQPLSATATPKFRGTWLSPPPILTHPGQSWLQPPGWSQSVLEAASLLDGLCWTLVASSQHKDGAGVGGKPMAQDLVLPPLSLLCGCNAIFSYPVYCCPNTKAFKRNTRLSCNVWEFESLYVARTDLRSFTEGVFLGSPCAKCFAYTITQNGQHNLQGQQFL